MPQVLVAAFTALGATTAVATVAAYAVTIVGTLALSQYQKRKQERAARAQFDAAQVDRFANVPTTVAQRELVLGRVRKGGHVFFRQSVGPFKDTFVMCIALAAHEIDGIEQIYFNDQPISLDGSGNVLTSPYARDRKYSATENMQTTSLVLAHTPIPDSVTVLATDSSAGGQSAQIPFRPEFTLSGSTVTIASIEPGWNYSVSYQWINTSYYARVFTHLGSTSQTADARLKAYFPGEWTDAHRAQGVAYLLCEFVYDETAFPSGLPNVTARIRGARLYDPRTGLTQWSENPALMMRHVIAHPQFGRRLVVSTAEDLRIIATANACDTPQDYGVGFLLPMYRANGVIPFGSAARDALDDLAQAMGGEWAYAAGEFFCRAGVYQAPVMSLADADLAVVQRGNDGSVSQSAITISTHRARNEKINVVIPRIWDEAAGFVQTPIMPLKAAALIAADGAELTLEVTMPSVFFAYQAHHVAGIMLRDSRDPLTVTLPFKLTAYPLQIFDSVTLTLARYGWSAKEFRILARSFTTEGIVLLTLKETSSAIYQYAYGFVPNGFASNSNLPKPWDISPPTITAISSGESELIVQSDGTVINGVRVTWAEISDASINPGGTVDVQYFVAPAGEWRGISVPGSDTQAIFTGIEDRAVVAIRARTRNTVAVSDWSVQQWHQVIGKTEPPPNIENLAIAGSVLSWNLPRRVPDLAGFVFRFHYGSNFDWHSAAPLHDGLVTESPWEPKTRPGGVITIMGKALDTTGNESAATANIVMNLGDPSIANVVEQWDFDALGWPHTAAESSGWTIVSGKPSANALDSFYGTDDQSFYGPEASSLYDAGTYDQMVYVSQEISVTSALAGSVMTLETEAQGIDLRVEYRLVGPESLYGSDLSPFYGPDADPFYSPPGAWRPWPGQIVVAKDVYQFRVTIGAGVTQGILQSMVLTIDAPDMEETIADLVVNSPGTTIPYTKPFTSIKSVQAQLQSNGSGAETIEIDKSTPLAPVIAAFNSSHAAVSGATVDLTIKGY